MTLLAIVIASFVGGALSVLIAASLSVAMLGRIVHHLVGLSAGVLLGTALLDILVSGMAAAGGRAIVVVAVSQLHGG